MKMLGFRVASKEDFADLEANTIEADIGLAGSARPGRTSYVDETVASQYVDIIHQSDLEGMLPQDWKSVKPQVLPHLHTGEQNIVMVGSEVDSPGFWNKVNERTMRPRRQCLSLYRSLVPRWISPLKGDTGARISAGGICIRSDPEWAKPLFDVAFDVFCVHPNTRRVPIEDKFDRIEEWAAFLDSMGRPWFFNECAYPTGVRELWQCQIELPSETQRRQFMAQQHDYTDDGQAQYVELIAKLSAESRFCLGSVWLYAADVNPVSGANLSLGSSSGFKDVNGRIKKGYFAFKTKLCPLAKEV